MIKNMKNVPQSPSISQLSISIKALSAHLTTPKAINHQKRECAISEASGLLENPSIVETAPNKNNIDNERITISKLAMRDYITEGNIYVDALL